MNIDWIETYLDLMQTRNFNASAERLGLTQSTVSHRIQKLEAALNQTLFRRGRSGAVPTDAGLRFETHARNLVREWQRARRVVGHAGDINSELRIGLQYDVARGHAGSIVKQRGGGMKCAIRVVVSATTRRGGG